MSRRVKNKSGRKNGAARNHRRDMSGEGRYLSEGPPPKPPKRKRRRRFKGLLGGVLIRGIL